jgi:hypothetical protein
MAAIFFQNAVIDFLSTNFKMQLLTLFLSLLAHYAFLIVPTIRNALTAMFRAHPALVALGEPLEDLLVAQAAAFSPALGTAVDEMFDLDGMGEKKQD